MITNGFVGTANRLSPGDVEAVAQKSNIGLNELMAFMEVESSGSGFEMSGRPKMLFEPHIFYRLLSGEKRRKAIDLGLAYESWGHQPYPKNSYGRLGNAMKIDEVAALKSASWGLGQILGTNHALVGYATVGHMVESFMLSERHQLEAMVEFIVANGIDDDLREHRWDSVARIYNGPGYAKHGYHERLANVYERLSGVNKNETIYPSLRIGARGFMVTHLQTKLSELKFLAGAIDGHFGKATRAAVMAFQADHGLESSGVADPKTWEILEHSASPRALSPVRQAATVADVRAMGSSTIKNGDRGQAAGGILTVTGGLTAAGQYVGQAEQATGLLGRSQAILSTFSGITADLMPLLLLGGGVAGLYFFWQMKRSRVEDHRSGANMGR